MHGPGLICFLIVLLYSATLQANVQVEFFEDKPKDRFVISNTGNCNWRNLVVEIDLSQSAGGLIFDTSAAGAGVEVFQPFEVESGVIELLSADSVSDGDTGLVLKIPELLAGQSASFTIDVDDTLTRSERGKIRITGSEIQSGSISIRFDDMFEVQAVFDQDSKAAVLPPHCG